MVLVGGALVPGCSCGNDPKKTPDGGNGDVDAATDGMLPEEVCENLPPATSGGTCDVTAGGEAKILKGTVLTPTRVLVGGQVAVDANGQITCVGCDCAQGGETVISCPDGSISPGLINTHDHITFTQNDPYAASFRQYRYEHRHEWRRGDGPEQPRIPAPGQAPADAVRWGELRFLMSGTTSIVGSGGQAGILRNLDQAANQEGLNQPAVEFDTFPLDDSDGTRRTMDCNYGGMPTTASQIASEEAYEPHTSEGIDRAARNEFLCQSSMDYDTMTPGTSNNLLLNKTAMIHSIGLTAADYGAMAAAGTGLIWSPRSNITLYGDTARVSVAARLGVEIALGTDWMPTGSMNMTRELACADSFNKTYLNGYFTDVQLWAMVTSNAASVIAMDDAIGLLAPGRVADISIFTRHGKQPYRAVIEAEPKDVALVMRGGKVLYGEAMTVEALAASCDTVDVCGATKRVCLTSEIGKSYADLQAAVPGIYEAFKCGAPEDEPTCIPSRPRSVEGSTVYTGMSTADDSDGDGIANAMDKCPMVFDPVRPMDGGMQADADGDGQGDACDVCPLDANSTTCTMVDPNDRDNDGVPNATDNCADSPNSDQADADMDGKGDVCDACPMAANPGTAGCPVSIYSIKNGTTAIGTKARITGVVTGKGTNGFFVQVPTNDPGYMGPEFSGIFVFVGSNSPLLAEAVVGMGVTVEGNVRDFFGQIELDSITVVTAGAATPVPAPAPTTFAEVKTGGPKAMAFESVLIAINQASTVTERNDMFGEFTLTQTGGTDTLIVDDFLYKPNPAPAIGQSYLAVRGILNHRNSASKLEPRDAGDLTLGAAGLASFGPAQSFARVGTTMNGSTFPEALTVNLTGAATSDTTVLLSSSNPSALTVPASITVPAGQTSATVPLTAVAQNASVTVTATIAGQSQQAMVRVLGASEAPTQVTLTPAEVPVAPSGTVELTATLDIPAPPGGTTVTVTVMPGTAGTAPASVSIAENQRAATFTFTSTASSGSATVRASLPSGASSQATVTVASGLDHLVLSQVYGGGGNSGATFQNDYVEIFNPSNVAVSLAGKSVQYGSATGTTWQVTPLPDTTVAPGGYFLVQQASGGAIGAALPTADATGTINMSATNGKVALVDATDALSGACPTAGVIDVIGYGTANCFEGTAAMAGSNTLAATRAAAGCTDSDDNGADVTPATPTPRNSASPASPCT